jgi:hypothetical protein
MVHSLDAPIAEQLALYADDLGGVTRLTTVSPYYDLRADGLGALATLLGIEKAHLHAHPAGTVRGPGSNAWPFGAGPSGSPSMSLMHSATMTDRSMPSRSNWFAAKPPLSGSANVTHAGLFGRNVEAGVLRVQRGSKSYWVTAPGTAPARLPADALDENETSDRSRNPERLAGRRTDSGARADTEAWRERKRRAANPRGSHALGPVVVSGDGHFQLDAPGIEFESWEYGRLILGLEQGSRCWEGFVSIAAALELIRRTGSIATRLMAMLAGTETPTDVAAILAWFREIRVACPHRSASAVAEVAAGQTGPKAW